jgi:PAS domain S-box-containing protein
MPLERKAGQNHSGEEENPGLSQASLYAAVCELQKREHQLQEIQERFHALATASGQIIWTARPEGISHDFPFWRAYTGQSSDDVQGLGWMDAIHPSDRKRTCTEWLNAVAAKTMYQTEYRLRRADGMYHPFMVRATPLLDGEGNVREWVGVCTDISDRKQLEEALRASETHFRATFEHAPIGIANVTLDGRWFDVNQQLCDMLGYSRQELLAQTFLDVTFPDDVEVSFEQHQRLWEGTCQSYAMEKRYLRKDGTLIWVNLTVSLVRTPEGKPHYSVGIVEDISRRKQLEEENAQLLKGEQQARAEAAAHASMLEATIEAMTDGVGIYDSQGYSLLTNRALRNILGIDTNPTTYTWYTSLPYPERIKLTKIRDTSGHPFPPERSPLSRALQGEVVGDAESEDMVITALDGQERYLSSTAAPIWDASGQRCGAVLVNRDVTERRRLERQTHDALNALLEIAEALVAPAPLEEQRFGDEARAGISTLALRLAQLISHVLACERIGIVAVEPETGQFIPLAVVSPYPEEEQQWWTRRPHAPHLSENTDPVWVERLLTGEVMLLDTKRQPFSEPHPFKAPTLLIAPMSVGKHLVGLLSIGHSNGKHRYTPQEIALAGAVSHLTALVIEREHLLRQREEASTNALALREANRQMDTFLGIASHELNTPLTTLKLYHQIIERRLQQLERQESLSASEMPSLLATLSQHHIRAQAQIVRLSQLVSDLLDVSRIQAGHLHLRLNPVDVVDIVRNAVEEQCQANFARTIKLVLPSPAEILIKADADRLGQVVTNYLTNALKYSFEENPIEVGIERQPQQVQVWVHDQGPGLTAIQQEHLWERFYRVPGVEIRSGSGIGLGLGLHICKMIVEAHHGQVGVQSAPGEGSTFWFTLPLAPAQEGSTAGEGHAQLISQHLLPTCQPSR